MTKPVSPFSIPNIRRYVAFKVLFNSRFYYPVFTILFLDFGLSVAQFATLNAIWAATIVMAEVPSGALADVIGRKRLLVFATFTMMVEVGMISFVPTSDTSLVFYVFLINRILSGLAEAAASGADEAMAYDALKEQGNPDDWGRVLELLARFQSIGFIIAMSTGAALYDPHLMESLCHFLGFPISLTQETTMRFPLYATLVLSIFACVATLGMVETSPGKEAEQEELGKIIRLSRAFGLTFQAG
ncbi:MAG: MFS transporter, partial [Desulfobacterium sp.]